MIHWLPSRTAAAWSAALLLLGPIPATTADELPRVVSTNLCADQLLLTLGEPDQILSVSWLAADPEESVMFEAARGYPLNHGSAEELLRLAPDVVLTGRYTAAYSAAVLHRLGYAVVELRPAGDVQAIERNIDRVAEAIGRPQAGRELIAGLRARLAGLERRQPAAVPAVVVRPGGFTVGAGSLADRLMSLAGLRNVAAEAGLDRWGSLSMETLVRSAPRMLVLTGYREEEPSLANAVLRHPVLQQMAATTPTTTVQAAQWACGLPQTLDVAERLAAVAESVRQ